MTKYIIFIILFCSTELYSQQKKYFALSFGVGELISPEFDFRLQDHIYYKTNVNYQQKIFSHDISSVYFSSGLLFEHRNEYLIKSDYVGIQLGFRYSIGKEITFKLLSGMEPKYMISNYLNKSDTSYEVKDINKLQLTGYLGLGGGLNLNESLSLSIHYKFNQDLFKSYTKVKYQQRLFNSSEDITGKGYIVSLSLSYLVK